LLTKGILAALVWAGRQDIERKVVWTVQMEDYERDEEEDEHFGIDHLKAEDAKQSSAGQQSATDRVSAEKADEHDQHIEPDNSDEID